MHREVKFLKARHDIYVLHQLCESCDILYLTMASVLEEDTECSAEIKSFIGDMMDLLEESITQKLRDQGIVMQNVFLQLISGNRVFLQNNKFIAVAEKNDVVPDDFRDIEPIDEEVEDDET